MHADCCCCALAVIWHAAAQGGGEEEEGDDDGDGASLLIMCNMQLVKHCYRQLSSLQSCINNPHAVCALLK
jgi:hypothetical protein